MYPVFEGVYKTSDLNKKTRVPLKFKGLNMLQEIHPKLPMRNKKTTSEFYINGLGFRRYGDADYDGHLMIVKDNIQIHFFEYKDLNPEDNYGQVYIRVNDIEGYYSSLIENSITIHPNGKLQIKSWGQKEFSILDPDNNLLTFGESV